MYNFNTALLGKQGWRLIQNPESLVARLYKARYYPGGNFLNAMFGNSPSYIWRSILEAQNLLKNGLSCRVGNGNDINILIYPWLPCESDPFIHTSSEAIKDQMVSSLLNSEQSQWDTDLLYDIFEEGDINLILTIPIQSRIADSWYLRTEKSGQYSVKPAYSLIQDSYNASHSSNSSGFWRRIWNLKIPRRLNTFYGVLHQTVYPQKTTYVQRE